MHFIVWILFFSFSSSVVSAPTTDHGIRIPLNKRRGFTDEDGHVDLARINTHIIRTTEKIVRGLESYKANEGSEHPSLPVNLQAHSQFVKRNLGGVITLESMAQETAWRGPIQVGTPPKQFMVDFDTGSGDLFLPGPDCKTENCQGHSIYNPRQSSTAKVLGTNRNLTYGDGSTATVFAWNDTVSVAGLTAKNETFGVATNLNAGFNINRFPADGILGLGYRGISNLNVTPLVQQLAQQLHMPAAFAFMLSPGNGTSELTFGASRPSRCEDDITWLDVTKEQYWQVLIDGVGAKGQEPVRDVAAIIDSGTTLMLGDTNGVAEFYSHIPGAVEASQTAGEGLYAMPCNSVPDVEVDLGERTVIVNSKDFNVGPIAGNTTYCVGGLASAPLLKFWILGDIFMAHRCTFFNFDTNQVGVSEQN